MDRAAMINDMTEGPLARQLVTFSLPIILGNILQACYSLADMAIVGRFIGSDGLSAVGIGGLMQGLLLMAGMGMGFGGQIMLSQQVGAKADNRINRTIGNFFTLTLLMAVFFGVIGAAFNGPLIKVLNTPAAVVAQTRSYYLICCAGIVFVYAYNAVCAVLRGLGESRLPTVFIAVAAVINVALDYVFIAKLGMNADGAALATVIAQCIAFLAALVCLYRRRGSLGFDFKLRSFKPDLQTSGTLLRLSAPLIVYSLLLSVSQMFINSNINVYGVAASAVDGIGGKLVMISNAITMGIYNGGAAVIGQCFGAGKTDRIRRAFKVTIGLSLVIWAVTSSMLLLFDQQIFGLFSSDPEVMAIVPKYMKTLVLLFFAISSSTGGYALIEGLGKTSLEMWAGIIESLVVKVIVAYLLSRTMGMYGYWLGCAVSAFTTPLIGYIYYFSGRWTKLRSAYASVTN